MTRLDTRPARTHVLYVDDEPDHAELLRRTLKAIPDRDFELDVEPDPHRSIDRLRGRDFSLVFLDYRLPTMTGQDLLRTMRASGYRGPVVMLTAHGSEYVAAAVTRAGADEYLVKSDLAPGALAKVIASAEANSRERADRELSQALFEAALQRAERARHDGLTGLLTRGAWESVASREVERAIRYRRDLALLLIDIDDFKGLNDHAGHPAGDQCLREVSRLINDACRSVDVAGRYGGDELIVLLPETTLEGASTVADRIREAIEERAMPHPGRKSGRGVVTVSIGVAAGPACPWTAMLEVADRALYRAKSEGRNKVVGVSLAGASAA
jgi:two-component system chemotaxis family response regulator WspR